MRALVKEVRRSRHRPARRPGAGLRAQRRADPGPSRRRLRHRPAHLGVGQLGQRAAQAAGHRGPRVRREITQLGARPHAAGLLAVGDLVTAEGHIVCGHCLQCRLGDAHLCRRTQIIGVDRDGAFADYIAMPASNVMKLDGIPTEIGAIMDPMGNAVHTVLEAEVPGSTVLVLGCGPIGCFAVGVARAAGASLVIASDLNPKRLELARAMGAQVTLDPGTDDVVARVRELTGGDGVDLVCEMSGHPSGHAQAFAAARLGGRVNLLGTPSRTTEVDFARDVIFKGLTLYGVTGRKMYETWHQMRRFLRAGQLDPRPVITHRFPLERIADAIQVIKDGQAGKVILEVGRMSNPLERRIEPELEQFIRDGTYKRLNFLDSPQAPRVQMEGRGEVIILSSNNYLGLCNEPAVVSRGQGSARPLRRRHRVGAVHLRHLHHPPRAGGRLCSPGGHRGVAQLRELLERQRGACPPRCSARTTSSSATSSNHASIIDGVRLAKAITKCQTAVYQHADLADLDAKLTAPATAGSRW